MGKTISIIGLFAALITIFVFFSGRNNIDEVYGKQEDNIVKDPVSSTSYELARPIFDLRIERSWLDYIMYGDEGNQVLSVNSEGTDFDILSVPYPNIQGYELSSDGKHLLIQLIYGFVIYNLSSRQKEVFIITYDAETQKQNSKYIQSNKASITGLRWVGEHSIYVNASRTKLPYELNPHNVKNVMLNGKKLPRLGSYMLYFNDDMVLQKIEST